MLLGKLAAEENRLKGLTLLDNGADVNSPIGSNTALQVALDGSYDHIVQMLLDNGADINASGRYGTALQIASRKGDDSIVQLLLDNGADINAPSGEYGTALQVALDGDVDHIVQMLLDRGADVDSADEDVLRVRSFAGRISLPSRLIHLDDISGFLDF